MLQLFNILGFAGEQFRIIAPVYPVTADDKRGNPRSLTGPGGCIYIHQPVEITGFDAENDSTDDLIPLRYSRGKVKTGRDDSRNAAVHVREQNSRAGWLGHSREK